MNVTVHAAETSTERLLGEHLPRLLRTAGEVSADWAPVAVAAARGARPPGRRGFRHRLSRCARVSPALNVLSIQSHVAYGHVGNSSAVFPLQRLGDRGVAGAHRAVLQPHRLRRVDAAGSSTGRRSTRSSRASPTAACWAAATPSSPATWARPTSGTPSSGPSARVRAANPAAVYCCDPVIGDVGRGVFVRPGIPEFMREVAVPAADLVTPNHFELDLLSGTTTRSLASVKDAVAAVQALGPRVVLTTSLVAEDTPDDAVDLLASEGGRHWRVRTPRLDVAVNGAGDAIAALFLAHWLDTRSAAEALGAAAASVHGLLARTEAARVAGDPARRGTGRVRLPHPHVRRRGGLTSAAPHRRAEDLRRGRATARRLSGKRKRSTRSRVKPAAAIAAPVSRARWQPRGERRPRRTACASWKSARFGCCRCAITCS